MIWLPTQGTTMIQGQRNQCNNVNTTYISLYCIGQKQFQFVSNHAINLDLEIDKI